MTECGNCGKAMFNHPKCGHNQIWCVPQGRPHDETDSCGDFMPAGFYYGDNDYAKLEQAIKDWERK